MHLNFVTMAGIIPFLYDFKLKYNVFYKQTLNLLC